MPRCKSSTRGLLFYGSLSCLLTSSGLLGEEALRWKFEKGLVLALDVETETSASIGFRPGSANIEVRDTAFVRIVWTIKEIDADGGATISCKILRVRHRDTSPGKEPLEIVFKEGSRREAAKGTLPELLQELAGGELSFHISPEGNVADVRLSSRLKEFLEKQGGSLPPIAIEAQLMSWIAPFPALPSKKIEKGTRWELQTFANLGTISLKSMLLYEGIESKLDRALHKIKIDGTASIECRGESPGKQTITPLSSSGQGYFDVSSGRFVDFEQEHKWNSQGAREESYALNVKSRFVLQDALANSDDPEDGSGTGSETDRAYKLARKGKAYIQRYMLEEARPLVREAVEIFRRHFKEMGRKDLAEYLAWSLKLLSEAEPQPESVPVFDELEKVYLYLIEEQDRKEFEPNLASALERQGYAYSSKQDFEGSERSLKAAVNLYTMLVKQEKNQHLAQNLGNALGYLGYVLTQQGKAEEAFASHNEAVLVFTQVFKKEKRREVLMGLVTGLTNRAGCLYRKGKFEAAIADYTEGIRLLTEKHEKMDMRGGDNTLAGIFRYRAQCYVEDDKPSEARSDIEKCIEIYNRLIEERGSKYFLNQLNEAKDLRQHIEKLLPK